MKNNAEDLNVILGRINKTFTKFENGMVPSGQSVEDRGREESDFDEY